MEKNSKIYVAGHRGLLGSAVVRQLLKRGFTNLLLKTRQELDLMDQEATFAFLKNEKPQYVFLTAAKVGGIKANMESLGSFLYENLQIQNNVMEASRLAKVKKLLFVGSSCIYPREAEQPISEDQLLNGHLEPTNEGYAIAKIAGIKMCEFYRKQYGCDYISAIPTNLFGINDNYNLETSHFVPAMIRKVHEAKTTGRKTVEMWGTGKPRREFMLSDDCADALVFMMENYSGDTPLNVGIGDDITVIDLAKIVAKVLRADVEFKLDSSKPDGMMRKVLNVDRLKKLGWTSKIKFEDGVAIAYEEFLKANQRL
jgi:GDP-L-fucose synthase